MNIVKLLLLLTALVGHVLGQDMKILRSRSEQLAAQQDMAGNYPQEIMKHAETSLNALTELLKDPKAISNECLQGFQNLSTATDSLGYPALVDLIDSFGKLGPGNCVCMGA